MHYLGKTSGHRTGRDGTYESLGFLNLAFYKNIHTEHVRLLSVNIEDLLRYMHGILASVTS